MATNKKSAKKAARKRVGATATAEPIDPRKPLAPRAANFTAVLAELEKVLASVPPPAEPHRGDFVEAMLHFQMASGISCGHGQEALVRIEEGFVNRNEFRVTEAFEAEEMLADLEIPGLFDRCMAARESVAQVYNDQNAVSLDFLSEAGVSDRNNFFARVPAIDADTARFLVNLVSFEEIMFSDRSTLRVQQRMGLEPDDEAVGAFMDEARSLLKPYGHIPIQVGPRRADKRPNTDHILCPACTILRLTPAAKKKGRK